MGCASGELRPGQEPAEGGAGGGQAEAGSEGPERQGPPPHTGPLSEWGWEPQPGREHGEGKADSVSTVLLCPRGGATCGCSRPAASPVSSHAVPLHVCVRLSSCKEQPALTAGEMPTKTTLRGTSHLLGRRGRGQMSARCGNGACPESAGGPSGKQSGSPSGPGLEWPRAQGSTVRRPRRKGNVSPRQLPHGVRSGLFHRRRKAGATRVHSERMSADVV